jgi:hypothetical protein
VHAGDEDEKIEKKTRQDNEGENEEGDRLIPEM